jgi:hypothetical protein
MKVMNGQLSRTNSQNYVAYACLRWPVRIAESQFVDTQVMNTIREESE